MRGDPRMSQEKPRLIPPLISLVLCLFVIAAQIWRIIMKGWPQDQSTCPPRLCRRIEARANLGDWRLRRANRETRSRASRQGHYGVTFVMSAQSCHHFWSCVCEGLATGYTQRIPGGKARISSFLALA